MAWANFPGKTGAARFPAQRPPDYFFFFRMMTAAAIIARAATASTTATTVLPEFWDVVSTTGSGLAYGAGSSAAGASSAGASSAFGAGSTPEAF